MKSKTVIVSGVTIHYSMDKQMIQPLPTTLNKEAWFDEFDKYTTEDWALGEAKFLRSLTGKSYYKNLSAKFRMLNTGKGRCKRPYYGCVSAHKTVYIAIGQRLGKSAHMREQAKQNNVPLITK